MATATQTGAVRCRFDGGAGVTLIRGCAGQTGRVALAGSEDATRRLELARELAESRDEKTFAFQRFGDAHHVEDEYTELRKRHEQAAEPAGQSAQDAEREKGYDFGAEQNQAMFRVPPDILVVLLHQERDQRQYPQIRENNHDTPV